MSDSFDPQRDDDNLVDALLDILELGDGDSGLGRSSTSAISSVSDSGSLSPESSQRVSSGHENSSMSSVLEPIPVQDPRTMTSSSLGSSAFDSRSGVSRIGMVSSDSSALLDENSESSFGKSGPQNFVGLVYEQKTEDDEIICQSCGTKCSNSHKYCHACASFLDPCTNIRPVDDIQIVDNDLKISLVSINEDSTDSVHIPLLKNVTIIGRIGDDRFPTDAFLSPKHARLIVEDFSLWIEDLGSLNGTFLRIRNEVKLSTGDSFLAGRQLLRFEKYEQVVGSKARSVDGTRYMGSPPPGGDYKLVQVGIGGIFQNMYCLPENGAIIGREKGDITFPKDRFMSGRHGQIYPREDGNYYLLDLNSSNGTWIKISQKTKLVHGDLVFLGQQLFRIDSSDLR